MFLIVFDGFGMGLGSARFWLEFTLGRSAVGWLLAWSFLRPTGRLDSQDGTLQLISTALIANPVEKSGHAEPNFGVP